MRAPWPEQTRPEAPDGELRWRVNSGLTMLKAAGAVIFALLAVFRAGDVVGMALGSIAALLLGGHVLRDLLAPVRVAADPTGVTVVHGFASRKHIPWSDVERVRVDERSHLGIRTQLLEIDAGDSLHLFSAYELSADCVDVAAILERARTGGAPPPAP